MARNRGNARRKGHKRGRGRNSWHHLLQLKLLKVLVEIGEWLGIPDVRLMKLLSHRIKQQRNEDRGQTVVQEVRNLKQNNKLTLSVKKCQKIF